MVFSSKLGSLLEAEPEPEPDSCLCSSTGLVVKLLGPITEQVDLGCPLVFLLAINEVISVTVAVTGGVSRHG